MRIQTDTHTHTHTKWMQYNDSTTRVLIDKTTIEKILTK